MEALVAGLTAFVLIVPIELPDKTFIATLLLSTRHPPLPVWLGVVAAFGVQCVVAVAAGQLVELLPQQPVKLIAAAMFAIGAAVLLRQAVRSGKIEEEVPESAERLDRPGHKGVRAAVTSFLVLFAAEWGDLSQLLTAGLVASGKPALPVFIGSWLGLAVVAGVAVLVGRLLLRHMNLKVLRYLAAGLCALLAVLTALAAL